MNNAKKQTVRVPKELRSEIESWMAANPNAKGLDKIQKVLEKSKSSGNVEEYYRKQTSTQVNKLFEGVDASEELEAMKAELIEKQTAAKVKAHWERAEARKAAAAEEAKAASEPSTKGSKK